MLLGTVALQILAALSGVALWRRVREHGPVALALVTLTLASLGRTALNRTLLFPPGPYAGPLRAVFHLEQGLYLLTPAAVAWVAFRAFDREPVRRSTWRDVWGWGAIWLSLVFSYPEIRGPSLARFYLACHAGSLLVACVAAVALLRRVRLRDLTTTHACALMLVGFQALDLAVGAWRYGLYGEAYRATQGGLLGLYLLLTFAQLRALARPPSCPPSS